MGIRNIKQRLLIKQIELVNYSGSLTNQGIRFFGVYTLGHSYPVPLELCDFGLLK